ELLALQNARIQSLALAIAVDGHVADDLAQEAWLALVRRPPKASGSVAGWLTRTMRNLLRHRVRDEARRRQRESSAARAGLVDGSERALERLELHESILQAVRDLKEPYRSTVLLRWFEQLEPAEIARRTGVPIRTVHTRVSRSLRMLRDNPNLREGR